MVDELLHSRRELRHQVREVHPEFSFSLPTGEPMAITKRQLARDNYQETISKSRAGGRDQRRTELRRVFPFLDQLEADGRVPEFQAMVSSLCSKKPTPDSALHSKIQQTCRQTAYYR
jgi:predicted RNase H-like nuclease